MHHHKPQRVVAVAARWYRSIARHVCRCAGLALVACASLASAQPATDPVYRFFNTRTGTHFYTIAAAERDTVLAMYPQFAFEGAAFAAYAQPVAGTQPVWRFYNPRTGTHFYTISHRGT